MTPTEAGSSLLPRRSERGFSLLELLIAMFVFLLVILAAYQVFERANEGYRRGQNQAEMVQSARVAFDDAVNSIRMAGFEFDIDGTSVVYPNQPDEAIEYMADHAITLRANFDFEDGNLRGREASLERAAPVGVNISIDQCCPIVTTANDEIVTYALGKNLGYSPQPSESIEVIFDSTGTDTVELPDSDGEYAAGDIRDGYVDGAGVIQNEETLTIPNVALTTFTDPPYVLYKFTFKSDGSVVRMPLVDNVKALNFVYYAEDGTVIAGNGGADAGRTARWDVRRVGVTLIAMEPELDRRYTDATDADPKSQKHRKYTLTEDVFPPNMGRRGQLDKSVNAPAPVSNVTVCTGQCGVVRISWDPPPPEDRIKDYVIQLFNGVPAGNLSNRIATFVQVSSFDLTASPAKEFVVFTKEDDNDIFSPANIYARVIARNEGGAESPITDSAAGAVVSSGTRGEMIRGGYASGYSPEEDAWPDAAHNNASGVLIETEPDDGGDPAIENPYYPLANTITLTLNSPQYTLNSAAAAPGPPRWTTKTLGSGVAAPMSCHLNESTPSIPADDPAHRTPLETMPRDFRTANTYVFRVSGSEDAKWSWDGGRKGITVSDPRNFIPGPENLYDFIWLPLHTEVITYTDTSENTFVIPSGATDQHEYRFTGVKKTLQADIPDATDPTWENKRTTGMPRALVPGEVYYYRFRTVSFCWADDDPADGVSDAFEADPNPLTAWSIREDFSNDVQWRERSLDLSPFYPPLLPEGDVVDERDYADQSVHDADEVTRTSGIDAFAIPGYAIPSLGVTSEEYIPPEMPTELYMARRFPGAPWDGSDAHKVQLIFNAARRNEPADQDLPPDGDGPPESVSYTTYELHRQPMNTDSPDADLSTLIFTPSASTLFLRFRTDSPLSLLRHTMSAGDTAAPYDQLDAVHDAPNEIEYPYTAGTPDYVSSSTDPTMSADDASTADDWQLENVTDVGGSGHAYSWRLVTVQCNAFDDGIDTAAATRSVPSRPFVFPCDFYDQVRQVELNPTPNLTSTTSVAVIVQMDDLPADDPDAANDPNCTDLVSARLLTFRGDEFVGTSDWIDTGGGCTFTFDQDHVTEARRGYGLEVSYVTELSDKSNVGRSGLDVAAGCTVRSDNLGWAYEAPTQELGCNADCGTVADPLVFGTVADNDVVDVDGEPNSLLIRVPIVCDATDFALHQIEVDLTKSGTDPIPSFQGSVLTGITAPGFQMPFPPEVNAPWGDPNQTLRLRWYTSFNGNYPVVDNSFDTLDLKLIFSGEACDITVDAFNFRVRITGETGGLPNELLCSERVDGTDPNPPVGALAEGIGRGPGPGFTCSLCDNVCPSGECPLNDNMGVPDVATVDFSNESFVDNGRILVFYEENCLGGTECEATITSIRVHLKANEGTRTCLTEPLPFPNQGLAGNYVFARLVFDPGISDIPIDIVDAPDLLSEDGCNLVYQWNSLDLGIPDGQEFALELNFDGDMTETEFTQLEVTFGEDPLPVAVSCNPNSNPLPVPTP